MALGYGRQISAPSAPSSAGTAGNGTSWCPSPGGAGQVDIARGHPVTYLHGDGSHLDGDGVATFYAVRWTEEEVGCAMGTACHVRHSMPIYNAIKKKMGLRVSMTCLMVSSQLKP